MFGNGYTKIKPWKAGGSIAVYSGDNIFRIVAVNASNTGGSWGGSSPGYQNFNRKDQRGDEFAGIFDSELSRMGSEDKQVMIHTALMPLKKAFGAYAVSNLG